MTDFIYTETKSAADEGYLWVCFRCKVLYRESFPGGPNSGQSILNETPVAFPWAGFSGPRRVSSSQLSAGLYACVTAQKFPKDSG